MKFINLLPKALATRAFGLLPKKVKSKVDESDLHNSDTIGLLTPASSMESIVSACEEETQPLSGPVADGTSNTEMDLALADLVGNARAQMHAEHIGQTHTYNEEEC